VCISFFYLLGDCNSVSLVASVDGCVTGFVILQLKHDGKMVFGHIVTLNVATVFRRRGIAQRLLFRCEEVLKLQRVTECRLEVRQNNYAALELYRRMDYEEVCLLKWYYGREHGLYLKKEV